MEKSAISQMRKFRGAY